MKALLGFVVNHFAAGNSQPAREILEATTVLSLRFLRLNREVGPIVLVDGSREPSAALREQCQSLDVDYVHEGHELSYVRAYNIGWSRLDTPYIGLMANDIIPHPASILSDLLDWIQKPEVGAVHPYFASNREGGDESQRLGFASRGSITCEPATFTLNLNLFKRTVLEEMGGLDEAYLASFAEPILTVRIRKLGYRVVMLGGTRVYHYDRLTKHLGESTLSAEVFEADAARWREEFSGFIPRHPVRIDCALWKFPFATTRRASLCWWLAMHLPHASLREKAWTFVAWMEPWLTRFPAGRNRGRRERHEDSMVLFREIEDGTGSFSTLHETGAIRISGDVFADGWIGRSGTIDFCLSQGRRVELRGRCLRSESEETPLLVRIRTATGEQVEKLDPGTFRFSLDLSPDRLRHSVTIDCDRDSPLAAPDTRRAALLIEAFHVEDAAS